MVLLLGQTFALWLLLGVTLLGPGMLVVGRRRWSAGERLIAAVGISFIFLYLVSLAGFIARIPAAPLAWGIVGASVAMGGMSGRSLWEVLRARSVRRLLLTYVALVAWCILLLLLVRHYAGGMWEGDWLVHYQKAIFFMDRSTASPRRAIAMIIERPPLMNIVAGIYLAIVGRRFENWQMFSLCVNLLIVPAALWIGREMAPGKRRRVGLIIAVLMACPLLAENGTYTWTKLLAGFFAIAGTGFYLTAVRKKDTGRMVLSFALFAAGIMVHYVTAPYAWFCALHYVCCVWRKRGRKLVEPILAVLAVAIVIAPWFWWAIGTYGWGTWQKANATLRYFRKFTPYQNFIRIGHNIINTYIPHPLRIHLGIIQQPSPLGYLRDYCFLIYQTNGIFAMGSVGAFLIIFLLHRRLRFPDRAGRRSQLCIMLAAALAFLVTSEFKPVSEVVFELFPTHLLLLIATIAVALLAGAIYRAWCARQVHERRAVWFWRLWIFLVPLMGISLVDYEQAPGFAHIFLQPVVIMGLVLLGTWRGNGVSLAVRVALAIGMAVDFVLGIGLQFYLQSFVFGPPGTRGQVTQTHGLLLSAIHNWQTKEAAGLVFWGDHFVLDQWAIMGMVGLVFACAIVRILAGQAGKENVRKLPAVPAAFGDSATTHS